MQEKLGLSNVDDGKNEYYQEEAETPDRKIHL